MHFLEGFVSQVDQRLDSGIPFLNEFLVDFDLGVLLLQYLEQAAQFGVCNGQLVLQVLHVFRLAQDAQLRFQIADSDSLRHDGLFEDHVLFFDLFLLAHVACQLVNLTFLFLDDARHLGEVVFVSDELDLVQVVACNSKVFFGVLVRES